MANPFYGYGIQTEVVIDWDAFEFPFDNASEIQTEIFKEKFKDIALNRDAFIPPYMNLNPFLYQNPNRGNGIWD
jgi:hypothetical protein